MHEMEEFVLVCSHFHGVAQAGYHSNKRSLPQFWSMTSKVKATTELLAFWVFCSRLGGGRMSWLLLWSFCPCVG